MPVQTSFPERIAFFSLNMAPSPILDLAGLFAFQVLSVAVRQGVFTALSAQPLSPAQLAQQLSCDEHGMQMLLEALAAIGYVAEGKNGRYQNTPLTEKWVLTNDAFNVTAVVEFWNAAAQELLPHAQTVLQTGKRPYDFYEWSASRPDLYRAFQQQMMMSASNAGSTIVGKVRLPSQATSLLDVGGAHGMYSILFCQQHPQLHATILDNHAGVQMAQENIAQHGLNERVHTLVGDLWQTDWGEHDIVLLFNVIHHFDSETNLSLMQRAAAALKPGGQVVILDQIAGNVSGKATNALIRLIAWEYYLLANGRVHEREEINRWLVQAGFKDVRFIGLPKLPGNSLVVAGRG